MRFGHTHTRPDASSAHNHPRGPPPRDGALESQRCSQAQTPATPPGSLEDSCCPQPSPGEAHVPDPGERWREYLRPPHPASSAIQSQRRVLDDAIHLAQGVGALPLHTRSRVVPAEATPLPCISGQPDPQVCLAANLGNLVVSQDLAACRTNLRPRNLMQQSPHRADRGQVSAASAPRAGPRCHVRGIKAAHSNPLGKCSAQRQCRGLPPRTRRLPEVQANVQPKLRAPPLAAPQMDRPAVEVGVDAGADLHTNPCERGAE